MSVAAALAVMERPQHREAAVLASVAHAMTDVTGFGLAGHLGAMARAANLGAELWLDEVPLYTGARALSDAGVASSLMPANRADAPVEGGDNALLYDPQTAGGLLAAVPSAQLDAVLQDLDAQGCRGHVIGRMTAGQGLRVR